MGIIKNLTGGDVITANPKYKAQIEFEPTWQLILAVNDLPRFNSTDRAFLGRLHILPFEMSFPRDETEELEFLKKGILPEHIGIKKDKNKLIGKITDERAGIIRFMIETYCDLENRGGRIIHSDLSIIKKKSYAQDNDDIGKFLEDVCIIDPDGFCSSEEITEAFKDYMGFKKASSKMVIGNIKKHNRQILSDSKEIMVEGEMGANVRKRRRGVTGIRLKTQQEIIEYSKEKKAEYTDEVPF